MEMGRRDDGVGLELGIDSQDAFFGEDLTHLAIEGVGDGGSLEIEIVGKWLVFAAASSTMTTLSSRCACRQRSPRNGEDELPICIKDERLESVFAPKCNNKDCRHDTN